MFDGRTADASRNMRRGYESNPRVQLAARFVLAVLLVALACGAVVLVWVAESVCEIDCHSGPSPVVVAPFVLACPLAMLGTARSDGRSYSIALVCSVARPS
jgi:hypothetical protein